MPAKGRGKKPHILTKMKTTGILRPQWNIINNQDDIINNRGM